MKNKSTSRKNQKVKCVLFIIVLLALLLNTSLIFSQNYASYNHSNNNKNLSIIPKEFKLYDIIVNIDNSRSLKFDIPNQTSAIITITDENGNIVKNYLFENIYSGSYEIKFGTDNLSPGNYKITLVAGDNTQSILFSSI